MNRRTTTLLGIFVAVAVAVGVWVFLRPPAEKPDAPPTSKSVPPDLTGVKERALEFLKAGDHGIDGSNGNPPLRFMTSAFRDRLRAMPPEQLPAYQYRDPKVDFVTPDGDGATVTGTARATTRLTQKLRPDGLREFSGYPTGGDVRYEMALRPDGSGGWLVDDFRFPSRPRQVWFAELEESDWTDFVSGIPEPLRHGVTASKLASELGAKAWVIGFSGGPVRWRCRVTETGQETVGKDIDLLELTGLNRYVSESTPVREEGQFVFGFRRWASDRMIAVAKQAGKEGDPNGVEIRVGGAGFNGSSSQPFPFLWYHWFQGGRGWSAEETASAGRDLVNEPITLVEYTVTETSTPAGTKPRQVKLTISAEQLPKKR